MSRKQIKKDPLPKRATERKWPLKQRVFINNWFFNLQNMEREG